jgi:hypothetical protein
MTTITIQSLDFGSFVRKSDEDVLNHLSFLSRNSRKPLIPKKIQYDRARVSRGEKHVTVHLCLGETETCCVSFVPNPPFTMTR